MTWPTNDMLAEIAMTRDEYNLRLAHERHYWALDQYNGDMGRRREHHARGWREFKTELRMEFTPATCRAVRRVLVVGCGLGGFEWDAAIQFPDAIVDAADLCEPIEVPPAWDAARRRFGDRIRYFPGTDIQRALTGSGYDLIVALAVLHHCPFVESAWDVLRAALAPGGAIMVSEYIGGRGLETEPMRQNVANRLWAALPQEYKRNASGEIQGGITTYSAVNALGFESVCSPRLRATAFAAGLRPFAERLCHPLVAYRLIPLGQRTNASADPQIDRLLAAFEDVLMENGWLQGEDWYAMLGRAH